MVRGLEHSTCRGREPGLGSLVERGHLPRACDCLKGSCRHERAKLLQHQTMQLGTTATDCSLGGSRVKKSFSHRKVVSPGTCTLRGRDLHPQGFKAWLDKAPAVVI